MLTECSAPSNDRMFFFYFLVQARDPVSPLRCTTWRTMKVVRSSTRRTSRVWRPTRTPSVTAGRATQSRTSARLPTNNINNNISNLRRTETWIPGRWLIEAVALGMADPDRPIPVRLGTATSPGSAYADLLRDPPNLWITRIWFQWRMAQPERTVAFSCDVYVMQRYVLCFSVISFQICARP